MMKGVAYRQPPEGLPHADQVMEYGMLLPCGHGLDAEDVSYVIAGITAFLDERANG